MNLLKDRQQKAVHLAGLWQPVLYSPEPAMGDKITIGIAFRDHTGAPRFRWLLTFERLRRVFGDDSAKHLPFLIQHAQTLFTAGATPDTGHLNFGESRELYAQDIDVALDELFLRFVPLARDFTATKPGSAVQNKRLREAVYKHLRDSRDLELMSIIPQNSLLECPGNPPRFLEVPLQGRDRFAALVSAHARTLDTIDRNIFPAVAELNAAANLHRIEKRAVFLLRPDESKFSEAEYDRIDEHVHRTMFILQNEGMTVIPEIDADLVASAVKDWAAS